MLATNVPRFMDAGKSVNPLLLKAFLVLVT